METNNKIKDFVKEFMEKMTFESTVDVYDEDGLLIVNINIDNGAEMLIGKEGNNLNDLQVAVRLFLEHKLKEYLRFIIDVNNYRHKKIIELKEYAHKVAQKVRFFKKEIVLPPMNSYERRIIHSELSTEPDIKTESIGADPERKVVVYPIF